MGFYQQFDEFDPLTGSAPFLLHSIAVRARILLKGLTHEQIVEVAQVIDWIVDQYIESKHKDFASLPLFQLMWESEQVDALKDCSDWETYLINEMSMSQYFAVLSLWKIADAIGWLGGSAPPQTYPLVKSEECHLTAGHTFTLPVEDHTTRLIGVVQCAIVATDAVCHAENLSTADKTQQRRVSAQNKKAANMRHKEHHAMKKQVFEWCALEFQKHKSMDAAAAAVAGKVVPIKFRTARSWIGDWVRSARRP